MKKRLNMKKMNQLNNTLTVILILAFATIGQSQNCYEVIANMSGFDTTPYQTELESAACELRNAFPAEFQDQFKVYDLGFYSQNEFMQGGFQSVWDKVVSEIPTDYYLIFGKQSDQSGIYTKFWVDINLPFGNDCIDDVALKSIIDNCKWVTDDKYADLGRNPFNYNAAELEGMNFLKNKIEYIVEYCCTNNLRSTCSNCPDDLAIKRKLLEKGFVEVNIDSFNIDSPVSLTGKNNSKNFLRSSSGLIDASSQVTVYLDNAEWNLNSGLENELAEYPITNMKGVVATNIDMCLTDLYVNIDEDLYDSYDLSIIYFLWTETDLTTNEIVDKKLYFKEKYPEYPETNTEEFTIGSLECHPQFGIYSTTCRPYELPTNLTQQDSGKYFISTEVNGHYHGYRYDGVYHWDELAETEYIDELPQFANDKDDLFNDCGNYLFSEYSDYAKRQSKKSTQDLVKIFERWTKNNVLAGLDEELSSIVNHFYFKNGQTLDWDCSSSFSKYIYSMPTTKLALTEIEEITYDWLVDHNDIDSLFIQEYSRIEDILPNQYPRTLPGGGSSSNFNATAAIAIGGFQGHEFKIISINEQTCANNSSRCYEIEMILTFIDIFGVGTSDRDRGGDLLDRLSDGRVVPGLTQMWLLQHCRNQNSLGFSFMPFEHRVNMGHKFKICLP